MKEAPTHLHPGGATETTLLKLCLVELFPRTQFPSAFLLPSCCHRDRTTGHSLSGTFSREPFLTTTSAHACLWPSCIFPDRTL